MINPRDWQVRDLGRQCKRAENARCRPKLGLRQRERKWQQPLRRRPQRIEELPLHAYAAPDHDPVWIEKSLKASKTKSSGRSRLLDDRERSRITLFGARKDRLHVRQVGAVSRPDGGAADQIFEVSGVRGRERIVAERQVADLPRSAVGAPQQTAVGDNPKPDARAEGKKGDETQTFCRSKLRLGKRGKVDVVLNDDAASKGGLQSPAEATARRNGNVRRKFHRPCERIDGARDSEGDNQFGPVVAKPLDGLNELVKKRILRFRASRLHDVVDNDASAVERSVMELRPPEIEPDELDAAVLESVAVA
nr:hypothetical protein [Consotaella salsifontis]